jgi:hypothetical protein
VKIKRNRDEETSQPPTESFPIYESLAVGNSGLLREKIQNDLL